MALLDGFNSRTREGCDIFRLEFEAFCEVSIHAPGRGATTPARGDRVEGGVSIHAPGRGATRATQGLIDNGKVSIHAPGRGATSLKRWDCRSRLFQFTHPGGVRRAQARSARAESEVSIHAPGRGATPTCLSHLSPLRVSIHAPGRGATSGAQQMLSFGIVSIHAPGRGAT